MRQLVTPSTLRTAASPAVAGDFLGIRIAGAAEVPVGAAMLVNGVFRLPHDPARANAAHSHRGIVVTAMQPTGPWWVATPFRELALFDDDEVIDNGTRSGYFAFDAAAGIERIVAGHYWVVASLAEWLSNAVRITVL